jgi:hypothetical protein
MNPLIVLVFIGIVFICFGGFIIMDMRRRKRERERVQRKVVKSLEDLVMFFEDGISELDRLDKEKEEKNKSKDDKDLL